MEANYISNDVVFIVAGGPSVQGYDFHKFSPYGYILAVNDAVFHTPANGAVSMDGRWMSHRLERLRYAEIDVFLRKSSFQKWVPNWAHPRAYILNVDHLGDGLSDDWNCIHAKNSGFLALNIAYLCRPKQIYLFGFDLTVPSGQNEHWYKTYEWRTPRRIINKAYEWQRDHILAAEKFNQAGISVFNVSPISIIDSYKRIKYDEVEDYLGKLHTA